MIARAESLARAAGSRLPTPLGAIAAMQDVRRIEFRPLLVDGGLAVLADGFMVYVRCDQRDADELNARFALDESGANLPAKVAGRARFTIAHEVAHTFLYDRKSRPPRFRLDITNKRSARSLEYACNTAASELLFPESILESRFTNVDLLDPDALSQLADTAVISKEALVWRLASVRRVLRPDGIIAAVGKRAEGWEIKAIFRHYAWKDVYINADVGSPVSDLVVSPEFVLCGGERHEVHRQLTGAGCPVGSCRITIEEAGISSNRNTLLLTIRSHLR
jgi:hypothetical protein